MGKRVGWVVDVLGVGAFSFVFHKSCTLFERRER